MPNDNAGLYGFDKDNAEKLRAAMVSPGSSAFRYNPDMGIGTASLPQPPPPGPPQSPLTSILDLLRASLQEHADLLDTLGQRLRDAGVLTSLGKEEAMPPTPAMGFPLGEEVVSRIAHIHLMSSGIRGLLERLAV